MIFRGTGERWKQLRCPKELTITSLAIYQGALYAAAGENGVYKLTGDALKPFSPLVADTLSVSADRLFATRTGFMGYRTGKNWWGGDLNIVA